MYISLQLIPSHLLTQMCIKYEFTVGIMPLIDSFVEISLQLVQSHLFTQLCE